MTAEKTMKTMLKGNYSSFLANTPNVQVLYHNWNVLTYNGLQLLLLYFGEEKKKSFLQKFTDSCWRIAQIGNVYLASVQSRGHATEYVHTIPIIM